MNRPTAVCRAPGLRTPSRRAFATCAAALLAATVSVEPRESPDERAIVDGITRYSATCWRHARIPDSEWEDLTQETFAELIAALPETWTASLERDSAERRELHRAIWRVSKRWHRRQRPAPLPPDLALRESGDAGERREEADRVTTSLRVLSTRQREVLESWAGGESVAEIASRLAISPQRVSDTKHKALRRLRGVLEAS